MCNSFPNDNHFLNSDAAKFVSTPEDMIVYAAPEDSVNLIVEFRINPVSNYKVAWFMGGTQMQDTDVSNTAKGEHAQTTYSISNVTKLQLGSYTVRVINRAIKDQPNEATFIVVLKLKGENNKAIHILLCPTNLRWKLHLLYTKIECDKQSEILGGKVSLILVEI